MKIAIILNGNFFNFTPYIDKETFIIAADGGANHCFTLKIKPHLIIGDLDSINKETAEYFFDVPQTKIADQDTTDLEKVLNYLKHNFIDKEKIESIDIFCAVSLTRVDHFMANLFFISRLTSWPIKIVDQNFIIQFIDRDTELNGLKNKTVSIFPVDQCIGLKLIGFKWSLAHTKYSISNVIENDPAYIKIIKGKIILIINNL